MLDDYSYQLGLIDIILRTQDNFFVVESPRPFRHDTCLKFIKPEVLLYVDSFYRNSVKQELKLRNVAIIELNTDCYDDEGFMLDRFRHPNEDDVHHGNADFGELMIKNVLNYLQSGKE
jgi:hypothetical protein